MKRILLILAFVLPFVVSCNLNFADPPYMELDTNGIEIGAEGGDCSFKIFSNYNWSITPENPAIKVSPLTGEAGTVQTVNIVVPQNTNNYEVRYKLTIGTEVTADNQFVTIDFIITQAGAASN